MQVWTYTWRASHVCRTRAGGPILPVTPGQRRHFSSRLTAKAVAVLLPILGTSWVFGVLAVNKESVAFQYLFAILNSLQGFFIFLFHCLLNSEVRPLHARRWEVGSSSLKGH